MAGGVAASVKHREVHLALIQQVMFESRRSLEGRSNQVRNSKVYTEVTASWSVDGARRYSTVPSTWPADLDQ